MFGIIGWFARRHKSNWQNCWRNLKKVKMTAITMIGLLMSVTQKQLREAVSTQPTFWWRGWKDDCLRQKPNNGKLLYKRFSVLSYTENCKSIYCWDNNKKENKNFPSVDTGIDYSREADSQNWAKYSPSLLRTPRQGEMSNEQRDKQPHPK